MATILERYTAAKQAATELHNTVKAEDRPMSDEERAEFDRLVNEASALKTQHERAVADQSALAGLSDLGNFEEPGTPGAADADRPKGSLGDQFVNSSEFKSLMASYGGKIPDSARSVTMDKATLHFDPRNALVTDPGFANPDVRVAPASLNVIDLFDAITVVPNSPQAVKTFTAAWTDAAAVVAEGALKPEASLVWTPSTVTLETVAQHVPVTNQSLSHNGILRSRIDTFLVNGIRARLQTIVATALAGASGILTQAYDTDLRTTMRKALTQAQIAQAQLGGGPIGTLISAVDAETLDLEAMAAAFTANGEGPRQVQQAWRHPLVVSAGLPAGYSYTGDLKQIELFTSGGIDVMTGWIDDQFVKNSLTILGETEGQGNVFLASLLVKTDLTAA